MTLEAFQAALKYIESQRCPIQITLFSKYHQPSIDKFEECILDFQNEIHAKVCMKELQDQGFEVMHPEGYYARIV